MKAIRIARTSCKSSVLPVINIIIDIDIITDIHEDFKPLAFCMGLLYYPFIRRAVADAKNNYGSQHILNAVRQDYKKSVSATRPSNRTTADAIVDKGLL